jgi:hypothetical protein
MPKPSRVLLVVLTTAFVCAVASSAQARCHKHWDRQTQTWVTHCAHSAPPAPARGESGAVPPPPGPVAGPQNTDPTDRYWFDPQD